MNSSLTTFLNTLKLFSKYGAPSHILYFGDSLGDNLLLTTLAKALNDRGYQNIWVKCDYDFLFEDNQTIKFVLPFKALLSVPLLKLFGVKLISPKYTSYQPETDGDVIPEKHIILKMADSVGLKGAIENKPAFSLVETGESDGKFSPRQIAIVTSTTSAKVPMANKEWITERYQQVVDKLSGEYQFVQLGAGNDAPLNNVQDMRGKTTVRQSAAILKNSMLLISHVGFMMHLARAVGCRAVIIYGGREQPEQTGYSCFQNIYSAVECSPCWLHNRCDYQKKCMTMITADVVSDAALNQLSLYGTPMAADILYNG